MVQNRSDLIKLTHKANYKFYFQAFLFTNNLTKHQKINSMGTMALTTLYDFMKVLNSTRKFATKNYYFPIHILFTTIYLL
jgi:hypothetical protein